MRVAYTVEQCWHDVPGGTATSMLRLAQELAQHDGIEVVGGEGGQVAPEGGQDLVEVGEARVVGERACSG